MTTMQFSSDDPLSRDFGTLSELIRRHAAARPKQAALREEARSLDYEGLNQQMDRVAAALQRDGVKQGDSIAICGLNSIEYAVVYLGSVRAGVVVAPIAQSAQAESIAAMVADAGAKILFHDALVADILQPVLGKISARRVTLDGSGGATALEDWMASPGTSYTDAEIPPDLPFNIIYSSGTTGAPKGIMQPHSMRWGHIRRAAFNGYGPDAVTLLSTPLYSNTTLVSFLGTMGLGGTAVLMPKFDSRKYLALAQKYRVTHTMLVPVQYQRLLADPAFDEADLSSYRLKFCTSAPFSAALKAEVLKRWPGGLIEYYGMTEGGGSCFLEAHNHPDKLHTVGIPIPECEIRLIDDQGREVPRGQAGEIVGHSASMMKGYHNQPAKTAEAEWFDPTGKRFIRTGDIGRFDEDGFLIVFDRKKDMIISGGFNIYPSDLEAVLRQHPAVADVAVVGVPSERWGETPVGFVVTKKGESVTSEELLAWANGQLGKTQRLAALEFVDELPRSAIGKILKRELRDAYKPASPL